MKTTQIYLGIKDMTRWSETLNSQRPQAVVRETEKAIAYEQTRDTAYGEKTELVWVPRSIINDGIVPFWFVQKQSSKGFYGA